MADIRMSVAARTDIGRVRTNNEDAFTITDLDTGIRIEDATDLAEIDVRDRGVLMVVSDGMGGHAAGEVASSLVVDSLRASLGTDENIESMQRLIDHAVQRANTDVFEAAKDRSKRGMGATLTAVLVHRCEAYIAEVGDSRAYVLRNGRLRQMTKDQSFVQVLLDTGAITTEQAKNFGQKNWIVQAMGLEPNVQVSIGRLQLRRDDRLLLCCDGLHDVVDDDELAKLMLGPDLTLLCNRMIEVANERGGQDNVTAIVASVDGDGLPLPDREESVTQTFEVLQEFDGVKIRDSEPSPSLTLLDDSSDNGPSGAPSSAPSDDPPPSRIITEKPEPRHGDGPGEDAIPRTTLVALGIVASILLVLAIGYWFVFGP